MSQLANSAETALEVDLSPSDSNPTVAPARQRKPDWIRVRAPTSKAFGETRDLMRSLKLNTVCEEAACPNIGECWTKKHATVMILGDVCTRACAFCNVKTGMPRAVDHDEPAHVAEAAAQMARRRAEHRIAAATSAAMAAWLDRLHRDAVARLEAANVAADFDHLAGIFMADPAERQGEGRIATHRDVAAANAAATDLDQQLARRRRRIGQLLDGDRLARPVEDRRAHRCPVFTNSKACIGFGVCQSKGGTVAGGSDHAVVRGRMLLSL